MKTVLFSISTQFNCQKHFHFKLFKQLYVIIQLSVNTVLMSKNSSPKLQHCWNLTIRLFSVISGHSLGGVLPLCRGAVSVFYSPSRLGNNYLQSSRVQSQFESYQTKKKTVLDAALLNNQHQKVRIKVKWSYPGEWVAPSPTPWCSSYRKGNLRFSLD